MKQPELGRKLSSLRQERNMTQEELVEACNVSVRTIQRIESGEVTPRVSTIKIIVAALGEDLDFLYQIPSQNRRLNNIQSTETWLQIGWIAGIAAFILGFVDFGVEAVRMESGELDIPLSLYLAIKFGSLTSYIAFYIGMIKLGDFFENRLLSIAGYLLIAISTFMSGTDIISLFYEDTIQLAIAWLTVGTGLLMSFGAIGVVFGLGLLRLQDSMGQSARAAGMLEIVGGICMVTVLLVLIGMMVYIPAMIIEIILLYKGYEYVRSERLKLS